VVDEKSGSTVPIFSCYKDHEWRKRVVAKSRPATWPPLTLGPRKRVVPTSRPPDLAVAGSAKAP